MKIDSKFFYIFLFLILLLIYQPILISDYLMNDEMIWIGSNDMNIWHSMQVNFIRYGRGLFGFYHALVYKFVDYSPFKIQFIRFINFVGIYGLSLLFFRFAKSSFKSPILAFALTLFLASQPAVQGILGYSLQIISNFQPSVWLSILVFYIYFYKTSYKANLHWQFFKIITIAIIFMLSLQSTQTYAFTCMIPLSLGILTDRKVFSPKKSLIFCLIAFGCLFASAITYKLILTVSSEASGYKLGVDSINSILDYPLQTLTTALNPKTYISVFKIWNYPVGFHNLTGISSQYKSFLSLVLIYLVIFINIISMAVDLYQSAKISKKTLLEKIGTWLTVFSCICFGALFILLESPTKPTLVRPHMTLTLIGVVTVVTAYSSLYCYNLMWGIIQKYELTLGENSMVIKNYKKLIGLFLSSLLVFVIAGAQSNVVRNIVNTRVESLEFVRMRLASQKRSSFQKIIVIKARTKCMFEPCEPWMGEVVHGRWGKSMGGYRYALASLGIDPNSKQIIFMDSLTSDQSRFKGTLVIDWNQYVLAKTKYVQRLKRL